MIRRVAPAALALAVIIAGAAQAADSSELWPELSAYFELGDRQRLVLDGAYARGKESEILTADLAVNFDLSLKPIARSALLSDDWQRSRYLWLRIGYDRVFDVAEGTRTLEENRGIVALHVRLRLPSEIWLESRARADLRWIGGEASQRYRFRLDASREIRAAKRTFVLYVNAEAFYDSRYDDWSRLLYQGGTEVTASDRFRYELYVARQNDRLPSVSSLNAFGIVLKYYR